MTTVHIFKPSGKWYSTAKVDMRPFADMFIQEALLAACMAEFAKEGHGEWGLVRDAEAYLAEGWMIVCPEPNHPHAHPIMLKGPR